MQQIPTANPWLAAVEPSPIGETKRWVLNRTFPADRPLIDLSQAVPGYPPAHRTARQHLGELLLDPTMHGYTPILGTAGRCARLRRAPLGFLWRADQSPARSVSPRAATRLSVWR